MIHFESGEETVLENIIVMDTKDYLDDENVRVCKSSDVYTCVASIQAYYLKNGKFLFEE